MNTKIILIGCFVLISSILFGQDRKPIYFPDADAKQEIEHAVAKAKSENKHVLIQVGGNWCPWCYKLHDYFKADKDVDSILNKHYVFVLVNFSKENKNYDIMDELQSPQRFGFPVLVVLDGEGNRIHTQDSALLEEDKGYSKKKVMGFLMGWTPKALIPPKRR